MTGGTDNSFDATQTVKWINRELVAKRIDCCCIEIAYNGETVLHESFGLQNAKGKPATLDTRFWIASMTKPVVSVVLLHLIERGKLSLLDDVSKYVKGFGNAGVLSAEGNITPVARQPTILDLLTHTSGVTYGQFGNDEVHRQYNRAGVFEYDSNNATMAARLSNLPLLYQPGNTFEYGMSTDLLGYIIEVVTGHPLDSVLNDIIFKPLGMFSTNFIPDRDNLADLAPSVIQETIAPEFERTPTWFSGGAGLFSTVSDYMLFARMLQGRGQLNDLQILKPETFASMVQQSLPSTISYGEYTAALGISAPWSKNGLSFGLGFAVRTDERESIPGGLGEFFWPGVSGANFWVDPKNNLIVVFLTHAPLHRTTHRAQLRNAVYGGLASAN